MLDFAPTLLTDPLLLGLQARLAAAEMRAATAEAVLGELPVGVLCFDPAGCLRVANEHALQLLGLPPASRLLIGRPGSRLFTQLTAAFADPAALRALVRQVQQRRLTLRNLRLPLVDGRTVEADVQPASPAAGSGWLIALRDVTDSTRWAAELRTVSRISDQNPHPIKRFSADGEVLYANPAAQRLSEQLSADEWQATQHGLRELARKALESGQVQELEAPLAGRCFHLALTPIAGENYVNIYLMDVTARREAERQIDEQRAFYEQILDHLPAEVVVLNPDFRYRYANPQAVADPETRQWLVGHNDLEFFAHRRRPLAMAELRRTQLRQAVAQQTLVKWEEQGADSTQPGRVQHFVRHVQPVFAADGALQMLVGYGLDITAIREAEQTLARSERQYRELLQHTQALVCAHDLAGRLLSANPAVGALVGLPAEAMAGYHLAEALTRSARQGLNAYLAQFAENREASGIVGVQAPGGVAVRYLLFHAYKVDEEAGSAPYVVAYAQDITTRIYAERALKKAKHVAEDAARARENFLANMSHEIRTPMNGVLGMAALLAKTPLAPQQRQYVDIIHGAGHTLLALLNDVLDMSKISSGKLELAAEPFDLTEILQRTIQTTALRAEEKGVQFVAPVAAAPVLVVGDAHRLTQVLNNLLSNALKFTEQGSVTLRSTVTPTAAGQLMVSFRVTDTGIGIVAEQQEKVFEEFTQAYADTTRRYGGTGLGLAISRRLVAQMGGVLVLSSVPGQGTTLAFTLSFLRAAPGACNPPLLLPEEAPDLRDLRVLLVEDNAVNRLLARLLLEQNGVRVTEAPDGVQALQLIENQDFDLVLLDIQLPGMNGMEVAEAIRALPNPGRAATPILALTANAFRRDQRRYLAAGMNGCLTKPFEEAELLRALYELTAAHRVATAAPAPVLLGGHPDFPTTALRLGQGSTHFVVQLVEEFVRATPALLERLRTVLPADAPEVATVAHQLLPGTRLLDAHEIAALLATLEFLPPVAPSWQDMRAYAVQELELLLDRLRRWLAEEAAVFAGE